MATWYSDACLDGGLDYLMNNANEVRLVNGYTAGDTYATVDTNSVAAATGLTSGSFTKTSIANGRQVRLASGTAMGNATANASGNLHYAAVKTSTTEVIGVIDCPDQAITSGNPVTSGNVDYQNTYP